MSVSLEKGARTRDLLPQVTILLQNSCVLCRKTCYNIKNKVISVSNSKPIPAYDRTNLIAEKRVSVVINEEALSGIQELKRILARSRRVVFLGGAGTSTESGIPDFRSGDGVFAAMRNYGYPPETLLSRTFFLKHTETFFEYYRKYLLHPNAQPNDCHRGLAQLERQGLLAAVITQNIDGLHQKAGSKTVLELHGSVHRNHCMKCGRSFSLQDVLKKTGIPTCGCGGVIKPDVVLYEEPLNEKLLRSAIEQMGKADTLIVGGTSLSVYPAAGLVDYFSGRNLVVINLGTTSRTGSATLSISAPIGEVFRKTVLEQVAARGA